MADPSKFAHGVFENESTVDYDSAQIQLHPELRWRPRNYESRNYLEVKNLGGHKQVEWTFHHNDGGRTTVLVHLCYKERRWIRLPDHFGTGFPTRVLDGWSSGKVPRDGSDWFFVDQKIPGTKTGVLRAIWYRNDSNNLISQFKHIEHKRTDDDSGHHSLRSESIPPGKTREINVMHTGWFYADEIIERQHFEQVGSIKPLAN